MGQLLHSSATPTKAVRLAVQAGQECIRALARCYGISPTTVQKWGKRASLSDASMNPKLVRLIVLTLEEDAVVVAFRCHTCRRWTTAFMRCGRPSRT